MRMHTVLLLSAMLAAGETPGQPPLVLLATIPLPEVEGRIDHLAIDRSTNRLLIAALEHDTVEVVDLQSRVRARSVAGFHDPQGIAIAAGSRRIAVSSGETGDLALLDAATYALVARIAVGDDADNVRYDEALGRWYVAAGNGDGAIVTVTLRGQRVSEVHLGGHPESFQLESSGRRLFVNVPARREVAVVDRERLRVIATWTVRPAAGNFPMALDESHHRLFVGCRDPARVLVYDTGTGALVASADTVGDADDLFYDAERSRVYVTGGAGFVDVFDVAPGGLRRISQVPTRAGARTSLFVPELNRLFVALPRRDARPAAIEIFDVR